MNTSYCNTLTTWDSDIFHNRFVLRYQVHKSNDYYTHVSSTGVDYILHGRYALDMIVTVRISAKARNGYHEISAQYSNRLTCVTFYKNDNMYHDVTLRIRNVYMKTYDEHDTFIIMIHIGIFEDIRDYSIVSTNSNCVAISVIND